jgi:uncharacterized protein YbbC (DUF1343 family)
MIEGANVSVGRGTHTPFEQFGAPWVDGRKLAAYLNERHIQGVRFLAVEFTPRSGPFAGQPCQGVSLVLLNRLALDAPALGLEIASALYKLFPKDFEIEKTIPLIGSRRAVEGIKKGHDPRTIVLHEFEDLEQFRKVRAKYLLYP